MRSAATLGAVVAGVNPQDYSGPSGDDRFARACLSALGVYVYGRCSRIPEVGFQAGWEQLDSDEAVVHANQGYPVLALLGDAVAWVLPSRPGEPPWIAQGGPFPALRAPLAAAFGGSTPTFWGHE